MAVPVLSVVANQSSAVVLSPQQTLHLQTRLRDLFYPPFSDTEFALLTTQAVLLLVPIICPVIALYILCTRRNGSTKIGTALFRIQRDSRGSYIVPCAGPWSMLLTCIYAVLAEIEVLTKIQIGRFHASEYGFIAIRTFVFLPLIAGEYMLVWGHLYTTNFNRASVTPRRTITSTHRISYGLVPSPLILNIIFLGGAIVMIIPIIVLLAIASINGDHSFSNFVKIDTLLSEPNPNALVILPLAKLTRKYLFLSIEFVKLAWVVISSFGVLLLTAHTIIAIILYLKISKQIKFLRQAEQRFKSVARVEEVTAISPQVEGRNQLEALELIRSRFCKSTLGILVLLVTLETLSFTFVIQKHGQEQLSDGTISIDSIPIWVFLVGAYCLNFHVYRKIFITLRNDHSKPKTALDSDEIYAEWKPPAAPYTVA